MSNNLNPPSFLRAKEKGKVVKKDGWHNPDGRRPLGYSTRGCNCRKTTDKGAYRDVKVELAYRTVYYYHQNPVVSRNGNRIRLSSCGWHTVTTKERINRCLPSGYRLFQKDFDWFLRKPNGETVDFQDGMVVEV